MSDTERPFVSCECRRWLGLFPRGPYCQVAEKFDLTPQEVMQIVRGEHV